MNLFKGLNLKKVLAHGRSYVFPTILHQALSRLATLGLMIGLFTRCKNMDGLGGSSDEESARKVSRREKKKRTAQKG